MKVFTLSWGHVNPIGPRACYDEGKRVAETLTYGFHRQDGVDVRVARIFNTYGTSSLLHPINFSTGGDLMLTRALLLRSTQCVPSLPASTVLVDTNT